MAKVCFKCGQNVEDNEIKCPHCGIDLTNQNNIEEIQLDPNSVISLSDEQINIEEPTVIADNPVDIAVVEENISVEEQDAIVENKALEVVSVAADKNDLEVKEEVIEIPEMPAPTIGEINSDMLGNVYDEAERINNEKIEAKRQQELAEIERKRQEEEAKRQIPTERPDLLAGRNTETNPLPASNVKKKKSKKTTILIIIILLLVVAVVAYYLFFYK